MSDFLNKYKSVYNVFLDNWDYQSHYVMFLEKLLYNETILPIHIKEMIFAYIFLALMDVSTVRIFMLRLQKN